jgi:hypothetical protein
MSLGMRPGTNRGGWTLPELLVGSAVATLLLGGAVILLHGTAGMVRTLVDREESLETLRTVWSVLHQEVGAGVPGRDWDLEPGSHQAIRLRAFRGIAIPCGWPPWAREGSVAWRGHRAPDPQRDSVLALGGEGEWWPVGLDAVDGGTGGGSDPGEAQEACSGAFQGEGGRWRLSQAPPQVVFLRYFERGRYSLEDGAFRYRRGGEGRQPLTPERVGEGSRFRISEAGELEVELELIPGGWVRWGLPVPAGTGLPAPGEEEIP